MDLKDLYSRTQLVLDRGVVDLLILFPVAPETSETTIWL